MNYTAIFLINGLCVVYHSLTQCLTLVYLGWGQKSEFFCLLVTTRRLRVFAGWYCKWATVALQQLYCSTQQPRAFEVHLGKGQSTVLCCCVPGGHIQRPLRGIYHSTLQRGTTRSTSLTMHISASVLQEYMV